MEPEDKEPDSRGAQDREAGFKPPSLHARMDDHSARALEPMDDECAAAGGDAMPESGPASHSLVGESGGSPGPWAAEGKKNDEEQAAAAPGGDKAGDFLGTSVRTTLHLLLLLLLLLLHSSFFSS